MIKGVIESSRYRAKLELEIRNPYLDKVAFQIETNWLLLKTHTPKEI